MDEIEFKFDELPVSVNKLYFNRFGRRVLASEGRAFKNRFITNAGGAQKKDLLKFKADPHRQYILVLKFYVREKRLINKSFGKDKRIKHRFKRFDVSNLIKLSEDCIANLLSIPDQNNWKLFAIKKDIPNEQEEHMVAYLGIAGTTKTLKFVTEALNE